MLFRGTLSLGNTFAAVPLEVADNFVEFFVAGFVTLKTLLISTVCGLSIPTFFGTDDVLAVILFRDLYLVFGMLTFFFAVPCAQASGLIVVCTMFLSGVRLGGDTVFVVISRFDFAIEVAFFFRLHDAGIATFAFLKEFDDGDASIDLLHCT